MSSIIIQHTKKPFPAYSNHVTLQQGQSNRCENRKGTSISFAFNIYNLFKSISLDSTKKLSRRRKKQLRTHRHKTRDPIFCRSGKSPVMRPEGGGDLSCHPKSKKERDPRCGKLHHLLETRVHPLRRRVRQVGAGRAKADNCRRCNYRTDAAGQEHRNGRKRREGRRKPRGGAPRRRARLRRNAARRDREARARREGKGAKGQGGGPKGQVVTRWAPRSHGSPSAVGDQSVVAGAAWSGWSAGCSRLTRWHARSHLEVTKRWVRLRCHLARLRNVERASGSGPWRPRSRYRRGHRKRRATKANASICASWILSAESKPTYGNAWGVHRTVPANLLTMLRERPESAHVCFFLSVDVFNLFHLDGILLLLLFQAVL